MYAIRSYYVRNVAPVLRNGEPHLVTDPVVEARPFELAVAFDDPGADSHVIEWDCNADGFFERRGALGTCVLYTDAQPHEVWVRVTDDDAGVVTGSVSVPVQNGPPTAFTEALVENVFEGTQVQLFGSGSDAGRDPGDAQFAFEWTWDSPDLLPSSVQNPFYVFPNEGDYVGRVITSYSIHYTKLYDRSGCCRRPRRPPGGGCRPRPRRRRSP